MLKRAFIQAKKKKPQQPGSHDSVYEELRKLTTTESNL